MRLQVEMEKVGQVLPAAGGETEQEKERDREREREREREKDVQRPFCPSYPSYL